MSDEDEDQDIFFIIVTTSFIGCLSLGVLKIIYKIFSKNRFTLEPIHIFLISYFVGLFLFLILNILNGIQMAFFPYAETCWNYSFSLFASVYGSLAIIAMQIDRFIAIKWAIQYNGIVDNTKSLLVVLSCVVIAFIEAVIAFLVTDYQVCAKDAIVIRTRTVALVLVEPIKSVAVAMTIGVLYYSIKTARRLAKLTPKPVHMPVVQAPNQLSVRRLAGQTDVFVKTVESRPRREVTEKENKKFADKPDDFPLTNSAGRFVEPNTGQNQSTYGCLFEATRSNDQDTKDEDQSIVDRASKSTLAVDQVKEECKIDQSFSKITVPKIHNANNEQQTPIEKLLAMIKTTAATNAYNLIFLFNFPISSVLNTIFWNCEYSLQGCEKYMKIYKYLAMPRMLCFLIMCYFIHKGLCKK